MAQPSVPEGEDGVAVAAPCLRFAHTATKSPFSGGSEIALCHRTGQAVPPTTLTNMCTVYP